jgi:hypothetical protein
MQTNDTAVASTNTAKVKNIVNYFGAFLHQSTNENNNVFL